MVADPVRTRYGVGEVRIDHAAGVPLGRRRGSNPPGSGFPYAADWDDQPNIHDARRLRSPVYEYDDDDAVVLPMEPRRTALLVFAAIAVLFIVVCASIAFSGISATTLITHNNGEQPAPAQQGH